MNALWMLITFIRRYPVYVSLFFMNEILLALPSYVGNVLFLKYLMLALEEKKPVSWMLVLLGGTALFLLVSDIYTAWFSSRYAPCAEERTRKDFYGRIRNTALHCGLEVYDDPAFYDDMTYVNDNIAKDAVNLLSLFCKMAAGLINILLIIHLFYETGFMVLLFSIAAVGISFALDVPTIKLQNKRKYALSGIERKCRYFRDCFFMRETFAERKVTPVNSLLYSKYEENTEEQIICGKKFGGKIFLLSSLKEVLSVHLLVQFLLTAYLLYQVLEAKTLRGSDFIATYNGANVIMNTLMLLVRYWGEMEEDGYTVGKYRKLLSFVPVGEAWNAGQKEIHSIEFREVSFSYSGTGKCVLDKISFCIHSGEKIAIVGRNGAGKTTLVHLLMGLYAPTEGEILVNGTPLKKEEIPQYRYQFAAFFQGMKPLEATVAENVALDTEFDAERISHALQKAGCNTLFSAPETEMIGVQFDSAGFILSGGEGQKLMLANCFYSNKQVLVMDEPSSALDPAAERALNRQMAELSGGKTTVFVTHRLSTVHMADVIYVIESGKIVEKGSHEQLLNRDGLYNKMWRMQLEKYGEI